MSDGPATTGLDGPYALTWSRADLAGLSRHLLDEVLPTPPERPLVLWLARLVWRGEPGSARLLGFQWRRRRFFMERHLDSPALGRLCRDPELRRRLVDRLGERPVLWRSEIWVNGPDEQLIPSWHHDAYPRLFAGTGRGLNVYVALTDIDERNGMEYLPASLHAGPRLEPAGTDPHSGNRFFRVPRAIEAQAVPLRLAAGEFVLFDDDLVHRSILNTSGHVRVALTLRVAPASLRSLPGYTPTHRPLTL